MAEILIPLSYADRHELMAVVPQDSEAWNVLSTAIRLWSAPIMGPHYIVVCDDPAAEVILHFAREHCPHAVAEIERAIEQSRAK